jgi:hypothetical protein
MPLVSSEPRITAAVLGLVGLSILPSIREGQAAFEATARAITTPLQFVFQWDDKVAPRESGIALFDAFGSAEKTMHINPGGHTEIPEYERTDWETFYVRHLGTADAPAKARALATA